MSQNLFSLDWLNQFSDPYAVLGLSVTADERRLLKRYHSIAKLLHPDVFTLASDQHDELANYIFSHLVNPAYQTLKPDLGRAEALATLRFRSRRLSQDQPLLPQSAIARRLLETPLSEIDILYEQAIAQLAELQFAPIYQFEPITHQLLEINQVYLHLKMGKPMIREKRTGIVSAQLAQSAQPAAVSEAIDLAQSEMANIYAQRHYQRAQQYTQNANWLQAVAELRDALRLEPQRGEYHALLAKVYFQQNLMGMARVHCRQALKFNPQEALALEYAARLNLGLSDRKPRSRRQDFFGLFAKRQ